MNITVLQIILAVGISVLLALFVYTSMDGTDL